MTPALSVGARRERLSALVDERGFVRVADASVLLGVSEVTVRADLTALEADSLVVRVHGGAMARSVVQAEPTVEQAASVQANSKRAIGELAASLVQSGHSVILDVGSTALAVAEALVRRAELRDVTVITNGLTIALALEAAGQRFTVLVTGGTLRPLQHSLVNPGANAFLETVHADIAFIGCNGIDAERGVTNINFPEGEVKRRMVLSSARAILVADGGKFDQIHLGLIGAVDEFGLLITAGAVPDGATERLRKRGLPVLVADAAE